MLIMKLKIYYNSCSYFIFNKIVLSVLKLNTQYCLNIEFSKSLDRIKFVGNLYNCTT